jgi:maltooligosyltrehalose trehalohydrolase
VCLQNHDQVGNRALGERLHHQVDRAAWRAASALLLLSPETPLLFMGQEWAATSPFLFFTDHHPDLGRLVTGGRRKEFAGFRAFTDPAARALIPDPQAEETFRRSRVVWDEIRDEPHSGTERLYRALTALRREAQLGTLERDQYRVAELPEQGVAILLESPAQAGRLLVVACLQSSGPVDLGPVAVALGIDGVGRWELALSTEDSDYAPDPRPPETELSPVPRIRFQRPGALVLRHGASESG